MTHVFNVYLSTNVKIQGRWATYVFSSAQKQITLQTASSQPVTHIILPNNELIYFMSCVLRAQLGFDSYSDWNLEMVDFRNTFSLKFGFNKTTQPISFCFCSVLN